jgi:hypothetical protein
MFTTNARPGSSSPIALTGKNQVKRIAISAFLLFHVVVIVSGAIPEGFFLVKFFHFKRIITTLNGALAPYATAAGLQVGWSMFAPNPTRNNTYIDAEITYRNGQKHIWSFPQMQELGYFDRYTKERYRKFATERLWVKENSALWPDAARYIARLNADASNPPQIVRLIHYQFEIPQPLPEVEPHPPEHLERYVFFVYPVKPDDLT